MDIPAAGMALEAVSDITSHHGKPEVDRKAFTVER